MIEAAWIESHFEYETLYLGTKTKSEEYEYNTLLSDDRIQFITWNDETVDSIGYKAIDEFIIDVANNFHGHDHFIESFNVPGMGGTDWETNYDEHMKANMNLYYDELIRLIKDSEPHCDSEIGCLLIVDNVIIASGGDIFDTTWPGNRWG